MSYLNQAQDPRRRATAILTAGAFNALLAAGLVAGLATNFTRTDEKRLEATDFPLPPPPEPDPVPPPPNPTAAKPVAPLPPIPLPPPTGPQVDQVDELINSATSVLPGSDTVADPLPPSRPPGFPPKRARPSNSVSRWITNEDYPGPALRGQDEGSVGYRLVVGINGRVTDCALTSPSGIPSLDAATCRLITSRARFEAATDETGAKVVGAYTGSVSWQIPD